MKAIVIGAGSIGRRHAHNLNNIGVETRLIDINESNNIRSILQDKFDMGFVCSPNVYHISHSIMLAERNIPVFCEKPFFTDYADVDILLDIVKSNKVNTMVGCNLRFSPEVQKINPFSKYISVHFGYNLEKWRPHTNHLESYSAQKKLGGGILLDAIHELDYLYYKFGKIKSISYTKHKLSNVTVDVEDLVTGRIEFDNGTIADFHLDYLSDEYQRYYEILDGNTLKKVEFNISNKMYEDEVQYFVNCVINNTACMNGFEEATTLLRHIL